MNIWATVQLHTSNKTIIYNETDYFIFLVKLSLLCFQKIRPSFSLGDLLQNVGQSWNLNNSCNFPSLHVNHLVMKWRLLPCFSSTILWNSLSLSFYVLAHLKIMFDNSIPKLRFWVELNPYKLHFFPFEISFPQKV
jgi:hypothetical protein